MILEEDTIIIAKAILEEWEWYDDYDNTINCRFCETSKPASSSGIFKHEVDCPVLVAKDVLT